VLQVPVQAVLERGKRFFCVVEADGEIVAKEVKVGSANEQSVIISSGLDEGEQVVLAPQTYEGKLSLPKVAKKSDPSATRAGGRGKPPQLADATR
jgi:hypothetical protein